MARGRHERADDAGRVLRRAGRDEDTRAEFESGDAGDARQDLDVPEVVVAALVFRGRRVQHVVEVGVAEGLVQGVERDPEHAGERGQLAGRDLGVGRLLPSRHDPRLEGHLGREWVEHHEVGRLQDHPDFRFDLRVCQIPIEASARVVVVSNRDLVFLPEPHRRNRRRDQLGVRVLQRSPRPFAVVLEEDHVLDAGIAPKFAVAHLVRSENPLDLAV
jgi:hypothetical protein